MYFHIWPQEGVTELIVCSDWWLRSQSQKTRTELLTKLKQTNRQTIKLTIDINKKNTQNNLKEISSG